MIRIIDGKRCLVFSVPRFNTLLIEGLMILGSTFILGASYGGRETLAKLRPDLDAAKLQFQEQEGRLHELKTSCEETLSQAEETRQRTIQLEQACGISHMAGRH